MSIRAYVSLVARWASLPGLVLGGDDRAAVGFESWLEQDRLLLLDFDPHLVGIGSQPFWLHWHDGERERRHAPDYFVRRADGSAVVVDVRADDRIEPKDAEAFEVTRLYCAEAGWRIERLGVPDAVLLANVRWLSRYRHPRCLHHPAAARLRKVFAAPGPLMVGADAAGDRAVDAAGAVPPPLDPGSDFRGDDGRVAGSARDRALGQRSWPVTGKRRVPQTSRIAAGTGPVWSPSARTSALRGKLRRGWDRRLPAGRIRPARALGSRALLSVTGRTGGLCRIRAS
ncbi:TnsA-like heteromeric transposase endonuclease subunit [Streptomyces sp. AC550_RSS872]|uniref:TnsA-like heteromeric transposase endonuclease subunit n=1 Tax=Streptomyces sp. AC550_RSS872 TaxID=2823689 RepID=UPI0027E4280D|nr:TnsA-like heteromeric transposase endonuclease subunit [Streptomyces sp. AC550_RSS872]